MFHCAKSAALNTPPEYDLQQVTIENFVGKLRTIKKELEKIKIVGYDLVFVEPPQRKPTQPVRVIILDLEKIDVKNYLTVGIPPCLS